MPIVMGIVGIVLMTVASMMYVAGGGRFARLIVWFVMSYAIGVCLGVAINPVLGFVVFVGLMVVYWKGRS